MKTTTFGSYIRFLRMQSNMTQSQLADKLNITDKAVSKWERDLSYPDIKLFPKLADVLGVSVNDLLDESIQDGSSSRLMQIFEMSHDFRTPLNIILGCVSLAEIHSEDKERVQQYLHSIKAASEYLLEVINKVMQTTHIDTQSNNDYNSFIGELDDYIKNSKSDTMDCSTNLFSGRRILVAEDMEINREIIGEFLIQYGAKVEFAEDGQVCLDKIIANPSNYFDLILMDIKMPNIDGIEATKKIRQLSDAKKASIPIIAVTANIYDKDRIAAIEAGMDAFTEKPIAVEKLFKIIKQFLQD